ncbi:MAG TPA: CusA/CzcA family heavy metal efflux RND transporter [Isosphaeraceae bacterium]|nr:CusA/CzcA family heavy metal efflux RND transporter [Isosphaeraceae bacterium]
MVRMIISWSLHNRLVVLLGVLLLIIAGVYSANDLNVEAYPDPTPPLVEVITQNPGASPEEMERLIAIPIEIALNGMPGLDDLRSTSVAGLTDIKCQFTYGTDYWKARQEVINRIGAISNLPPSVTPGLSPWSPTGEIVRYVLEGPGYTLNELKSVQDWVLNRALKTVPGVIDVTGYGGTVKQYLVLVYPNRLSKYGVSLQQVQDAISKSNANVGGDILTLGSQSHNVRAIGLLGKGIDPLDPAFAASRTDLVDKKLADIRNVVIAQAKGTPILVQHVADVVEGHHPRLGIVGQGNRDDVVEGIVLMRKYEKSLPVSNLVLQKIDEIGKEKLLPPGMKITIFNQRTELVHVTTYNVLHNLLVGMSLVIAILFVFLGDLASASIVAIMIPLALLFSITVIYWQGKSANLLSIGAVDFGIIVDSSTIIVENIYRHITAHDADRSRPLIDRIVEASYEIERALFFSTTIIVCAFIPLFSMTGPEGALFGPMANTYAFAICGALVMAVTLAPVLCSYFFKNKSEAPDTILDRIMKLRYLRALSIVLKVRGLTLAIMGSLFLWAAFLIPHLGGEFMPPLEEGYLWIRAILPRTISLEDAARIAPRLREVISSIPEIRGVMSHLGRPDDGTDVTSFFNLEFGAPLKPMETWRTKPIWPRLGAVHVFGWTLGTRYINREEIEDELMARFREFPSVNFNFSQYIRDNVEEALSGVKGANSIKMFGNDLDVLESTGQRIAEILKTVRGIEHVGLFHIVGQPNLEIEIDRDLCARHGVNVADVENVVQVAIGGKAFSQMVEGEKLFDIVLRLPRDLRNDPTVISRILVDVPGGSDNSPGYRIPLSQLTHITAHKPGATYVYRENNRRFIPIKFSVRDRDLASAIAEAQKRVLEDPITGAQLKKQGYSLMWSGEFEQMEEANNRLMWIIPLSLGLIMLLLYSMFSSVKDSLLVMVNVLEAAMGGVFALYVTGTHFSISAAVGFVSVFGVAVQDGVLLISYFNQMRSRGYRKFEAVLRGAELRVRPVVMTSLTAALGLLPAAMATSIGSQAQKPLAIVVVGAMLCTLFLTRYMMPVLYTYFPAPRGHGEEFSPLVEGTNYSSRFVPDLPEEDEEE